MSQPLNNLDIIILIILGLSALIALSRGLIKEVLSIIGWVLGSAAVIYLLPVFTPITKEYIANGMIAGVVTSIFILILFMVIWILLTGNIVGKVRSSKLSSVDRVLGLFFGIMRAFCWLFCSIFSSVGLCPKTVSRKLSKTRAIFS